MNWLGANLRLYYPVDVTHWLYWCHLCKLSATLLSLVSVTLRVSMQRMKERSPVIVILRTWAIYGQKMWPVVLLGVVYVMGLSVQTVSRLISFRYHLI